MKKEAKEIHPRWRENGDSLTLIKNNPSKEEVERLKEATIESIRKCYNSGTNEDGKEKN